MMIMMMMMMWKDDANGALDPWSCFLVEPGGTPLFGGLLRVCFVLCTTRQKSVNVT